MLDSLIDFLVPVNLDEIANDEGFKNAQMGGHIAIYNTEFPDITNADIVLVGCNEWRGEGIYTANAANEVRAIFYKLYHWHDSVTIVDIGNIKIGATLQDTYAAVKEVVKEVISLNKKIVVIGGSHDVMLGQYYAYQSTEKIIEVCNVDAVINIDWDSVTPAENFLMEMLTAAPNFIRSYNHIGFQSYLVHPKMLEVIDKLGFECTRVGRVKEDFDDVEPHFRNAELLSFDIAAIQNAHAPANYLTPNGFTGEEACILMQYAGQSAKMQSIGIYGYNPEKDTQQLTAKQISHMLWYLMDGVYKGKQEPNIEDAESFREFHLQANEVETTFLQSIYTGTWWMKLPNGKYIACSYKDYLTASKDEIPDRWMKAIERM